MSEKRVFHNIIDGEVQASASGAMMDVVNPATGEVYASAPNSDAQDVDQAFRALRVSGHLLLALQQARLVRPDAGCAELDQLSGDLGGGHVAHRPTWQPVVH